MKVFARLLRRLDARARGGLAWARGLVASSLGPSPPRRAPGDADPVRAARARRTVEQVVVLALAANLLAPLVSRDPQAASPSLPPGAAGWLPLPVDVAIDGPSRLRLLPGLGVVRTRALLDDRARHGPVTTLEGLRRIRGFGAKTVAALRTAGAIVGSAASTERGPGAAVDPPTVPVGLAREARPKEEAR